LVMPMADIDDFDSLASLSENQVKNLENPSGLAILVALFYFSCTLLATFGEPNLTKEKLNGSRHENRYTHTRLRIGVDCSQHCECFCRTGEYPRDVAAASSC